MMGEEKQEKGTLGKQDGGLRWKRDEEVEGNKRGWKWIHAGEKREKRGGEGHGSKRGK